MIIRSIKVLIAIVYHLFIRPIIRLISGPSAFSCIILCFHSIKGSERIRFARQLDFIMKKARVIPIGSLELSSPYSRHVAITFDDAYLSALKYGATELVKRRLPFSIYIPSGCLGGMPAWLKGTGDTNEFESIATIADLLAIPPELVTLGSHTVNHVRLKELGEDAVWSEVKGSKGQLESLLGRKVDYFAFPYGDYDESLIKSCRKAGYKKVLTMKFETPYAAFDGFAKGRIAVEPSDWMVEFRLKLAGSYAWMATASILKSRLKRLFSAGL